MLLVLIGGVLLCGWRCVLLTAGRRGWPPSSQGSGAAASTRARTGDAAARALVDAIRGCEDAACRGELWEDPAAATAIEAASGEGYRVQVVDEYGGVAAVRIVGESVTQILVMVQADEKWLVREVYDLADQP